MSKHELPPPLVHFASHPIRWIKIKLELLFSAVVLAHIGMFIVVGLYYLVTQNKYNLGGHVYTLKHWWDFTAVKSSDLRHSIRDVGEGVLGGLMAQAIVWNHYKKKGMKAGKVFGVLHKKLHLPEIPTAFLTAILLGAGAFALGHWILTAFHYHVSNPSAVGSLWNRTQNIWTSSWDKKFLGYVCAFAARRPMHIIFDKVQLWFAERRVALGKGTRLWQPPVFKARVNDLSAAQILVTESEGHSTLQNVLMMGSLLGGLALAGYGYYVLTYIAGK